MDFEDQVGGFLEADRSSEDALTRASPEVSRALRRAARYLLDVERRLSDAAEGTGG
jgi:hypothetical protein